MPNLVSLPFELIIAGIDRSAILQSITLSQPDTSAQRHVPVTGKVDLFVPLDQEEDFTYTTNATIAARWAQGASVTYKIANESGTLVNHPLSGGKLFILKEPSPPKDGLLSLAIGCEIAFQNQREADADVSGIITGTSTPRKTVVEKVLKAAGINSYSIPTLSYPFAYPIPKVGGSFVQMAGKLVGAANHILHCNASGTVIASPIDLTASPVTTLTVGVEDVDYEPIDGSNLPTISELTISGTTQVPDSGTYPILSVSDQYQTISWLGEATQERFLVGRVSEQIFSESYQVSLKESAFIILGRPSRVTDLAANSLQDTIVDFDSKLRLRRKIIRDYAQLVDLNNKPVSPFYETRRVVESYTYDESLDVISQIVVAKYSGTIILGQPSILLLPESRVTTAYSKFGDFWTKSVTNESAFTFLDQAFKGDSKRTITVNGQSYVVTGFPDDIPAPEFKESTSTSDRNNDDSTRPPATTYSRLRATKEKEISSTVKVIPLAGVPSKEKFKPVIVDYMVSNDQAYEYGKLEVILIAGRKQARMMITELSDALLSLRPRSRIDIIYRSRKFRCLVDSITYSQNFNARSIGFICDVINSSPLSNLSEITPLLVNTNSAKITAQAQPATVAIAASIKFNVLAARAEPATVSITAAVQASAVIAAQSQAATVIATATYT